MGSRFLITDHGNSKSHDTCHKRGVDLSVSVVQYLYSSTCDRNKCVFEALKFRDGFALRRSIIFDFMWHAHALFQWSNEKYGKLYLCRLRAGFSLHGNKVKWEVPTN